MKNCRAFEEVSLFSHRYVQALFLQRHFYQIFIGFANKKKSFRLSRTQMNVWIPEENDELKMNQIK